MDDATGIDRISGFDGRSVWYRVHVSPEAAQRARELATGGVGPPWRVGQQPASLTVAIETTDPAWFLELDVKVRQSQGKHSVR